MKFRIGLAEGWQELHRKSSVRFSAAVALLASVGPQIAQAWGMVPDDLKGYLPTSVKQTIGYLVLACAFLALRYTRIERKGPTP
ncbi:hypothetical protein [Herbaspirillum chlorophenolicum]|uniref:DUF7940 domain-containing protein n=1 Tax=Herbaspirillum chlorophenolicum TaxID=211589 RepID=UPI00067AC754|nr:hypothetical protein [Herbaspirillum chlorophenolicum]